MSFFFIPVPYELSLLILKFVAVQKTSQERRNCKQQTNKLENNQKS